MNDDTNSIPLATEIEGSVIIDETIFNDAKILGVDNENRFVVLIYGSDGYQTRRVETVYYGKDQATAELERRLDHQHRNIND